MIQMIKALRMRNLLLLFSIISLALTACGGSSDVDSPITTRISAQFSPPPPATFSSVDLTATAIVALATQVVAGPPVPDCETGPIIKTFEPAIAGLQRAIEGSGVTVSAINVFLIRDQQTCTFSEVINTFVSVRLPVDDVTNDSAIGDVASVVLQVFVNMTLPQPATISLQFEAGYRQRSFSVNYSDAEGYVADDLRGVALIAEIED